MTRAEWQLADRLVPAIRVAEKLPDKKLYNILLSIVGAMVEDRTDELNECMLNFTFDGGSVTTTRH